MKIGRKARVVLFLPVLFLFVPADRPRAEVTLSAQVLPHYQTGDYGAGTSTDISYLPFVFGLDSDRHALRVTVPWLSIRSEEPVIISGGDVIGRPPAETTVQTDESGLGDIALREEYFFLRPTSARQPWISGIARLKIPTADEEAGLGTGEFDYGAGAGLIQPLTRQWALLAELGYIWRGQPSGFVLQNAPWLSAGAQWVPATGSTIYATYDSVGSAVEGRDDIRDLSIGYDQRVTDRMTLRSVLYIGLSDTAEDFGVTIGVAARKHVGSRPQTPRNN